MKTASSPMGLAAAIAVSAVLVALPLSAWADLAPGDTVGKTDAEIRASLESLGYVVNEIEIEADEIEADVTLNGEALELEIDPATGQVAEIERDD